MITKFTHNHHLLIVQLFKDFGDAFERLLDVFVEDHLHALQRDRLTVKVLAGLLEAGVRSF